MVPKLGIICLDQCGLESEFWRLSKRCGTGENIPGITYMYDPQSGMISPVQRLTTGYCNPDDAII